MTVRVHQLKVDAHEESLAVHGVPRFTWQMDSDERAVMQRGYRLRICDESDDTLLWDSGLKERRASHDSSLPAELLRPGRSYRWRVDVYRTGSSQPAASASARFETAPDADLWSDAKWIGKRRDDYQHDDHRPAPYVRRAITPRGPVRRARIHATAGGVYELWADGGRISASSLGPGWTDYDKRVAFHTYDLTSLFAAGNPLYVGAIVADGWYSGGVGPFHRRNFWGTRPTWRAIVVLDYEDGQRDVVVTDSSWEAAFGPIRAADLLQGQVIDARMDLGDWSSGHGDGTWGAADIEAGPSGKLVPARLAPPAPIAQLAARSHHESSPGSHIYDFGQNFAGYVRLRVTGAAGTMVRLRHAEVLEEDGNVYLANLRGARATDTFILSGGADVFEARFTSHGFRYVEITGLSAAPCLEDVTGIAVSSATVDTGFLETDNPLVNRLVENTRWSLRSNFMDVPTDCPSRDERVGWTGDGQVFAPSACWLSDVHPFFDKWLDDIIDAVLPSGAVPDIAPAKNLIGRLSYTEDGSSGYAESIFVIPWMVYDRYGDASLIERAYPAAAGWIEYVMARTNELVWRANRNTDYGDWLAPVETPKDLTATAYFNMAVNMMARFAEVLGRVEESRTYNEMFMRTSAAFRAAFVSRDGTMEAATQAGYTLALAFDLLLPEQRIRAAAELASDVETRGHLTTGFLSISHLLPTLTKIGRTDLAYRLALNESYPSWGYEIAKGATTIWERWDGIREDGSLQDPLMNSFNHYAFGSVIDWLFTTVGGIHPAEPGFASLRVAPQAGFGVDAATAVFDCAQGRVEVAWRRHEGELECTIQIPANTTAEVTLNAKGLTEAGTRLPAVIGVSGVTETSRSTTFTIGSGSYSFRGEDVTAHD